MSNVSRQASPTAAIIDSQSVKGAEKGVVDRSARLDAGKKIKGKKRHLLVDTEGLMLHAIVHAADIQDRDGGALPLATLFGLYPFLSKLYADAGNQGPRFQQAVTRAMGQLEVEIVKRCDVARSWYCPSAGWSSARSPGSTVTVGLPGIGRTTAATHSLSFAWRQSD